MPPGRRHPAPRLLLLAALALAAIAVAPRGLVRAAALGDVDRPDVPVAAVVSQPGDEVSLPGVRAVVAREEDGFQALLDHLATPPAGSSDVHPAATLQDVAMRPTLDAEAPAPRSTEGDRAPPGLI